MKSREKILLALGVGAIVAGFWLCDQSLVKPAKELEAYRQSLRAQGEKLDISELIPPPVPDESNGLPLLRDAFHEFMPGTVVTTNPPGIPRAVAPGKALACWQQPYLWSRGRSNSWADLKLVLETNRLAIDLLHQAAAFPDMDFQFDYTNHPLVGGSSSPAFSPKVAWLLRASAINHLHEGDPSAAGDDIRALLKLLQANQNMIMADAQGQRWAMMQMALSATWELLQFPGLADADLARIESCWSGLDLLGALEKTLEMRRDQEFELSRTLKDSSEATNFFATADAGARSWPPLSGWEQMAQDTLTRTKLSVAVFAWRTSWNYSDEELVLRQAQGLVDGVRKMRRNPALLQAYNNIDTNSRALWNTGFLPSPLWKTIGMAQYRGVFIVGCAVFPEDWNDWLASETARRTVVAAITLRRYQLRHGSFPEQLAELTPDFLPAVPLDPMDGRPFRYRRNGDGSFLLYSIGFDGVDDGGDPTNNPSSSQTFFFLRPLFWPLPGARDWVWPTPATPEEVRDFYDRGLK